MFCKFTPMTRPLTAFIRIPDPDRGPTPTVFCMLQMSREWANLWGRREGRVDRLWADRAVAQVAPSRSRTPLPPVGHTRLPAAPHRIADDLARSADVPGRGEAPIDNVEILGEGGERIGYRRGDRGCGALCCQFGRGISRGLLPDGRRAGALRRGGSGVPSNRQRPTGTR